MPTEQKPDNPFDIDDGDLSGEWSRMAQRTRDAGRRESDARHEYNQAKAQLDVCRARLGLAIRKKPGDYGLPESSKKAPSNDVVESVIDIQPEYQKALDKVHVAQRNLGYAEADTRAFESMRMALVRKVELLQIHYFSERDPPTTAASREALQDIRKRAAHGGGIDPHE